VPVSADDHRSTFELLEIFAFDEVERVVPSERREALSPRHVRTLALDLRGDRLRKFLEVFGIGNGLRRESAQNRIRCHLSSLLKLIRFSELQRLIILRGE